VADRAVRLTRRGLTIDGVDVPLLAGSVHYWRLEPRFWRDCLLATKRMGFPIIDTYVPWSVHETAPGILDLGEHDPAKDVGAFLRLVKELGLFAIVRPGPHINAELTHFGIPERIIWDQACQARGPNLAPVVLPMIPLAFPVPSYASKTFLDESRRYFALLGKTLAPLLHPHGPIVMVQVDNEGAMYFRDGPYDQDYHPDAIAGYRDFLREKYKTLDDLPEAYTRGRASAPRITELEPPKSFDAESAADLVRHIDWMEYHEVILATAMAELASALADAGIVGVPLSHNFPPGQESTPLNAARIGRAVDLIGYDYYNRATPATRAILSRRTSELAVRSDALDVPPFACELGAGFPPFFPPLEERDSIFTVLCALAYGLRAFNLYMAVERDRWIGAPIDPHGRPRPFAVFWTKLCEALGRVDFFSLRRRTPVRILVPRNERRLARAMHAFGPVSGAFFAVSGAGAKECAFETDLGLGFSPAVDADSFTRLIESSLEARGVPFAHVGGEDRDVSLEGARWLIVVSSGGLSATLMETLQAAARAGALITIGPRLPELGGARRALKTPFDLDGLGSAFPSIPLHCPLDPAQAERVVGDAISALGLPTLSSDDDQVHVTLHEDAAGNPRVLFVVNPTTEDRAAHITVSRAVTRASDVLSDATYPLRDGILEMTIRPKTVKMLALSAG
jgi:beta-galactosidase